MISDLDIWRAAELILKHHGQEAAVVAAQRADDMLGQNDLEGQRVWRAILMAIEELQREKANKGEPVN